MKINQKNIGAYVIAGLLIFILLLCFTVPGFAGAIARIIECDFSPVSCVKVIQ